MLNSIKNSSNYKKKDFKMMKNNGNFFVRSQTTEKKRDTKKIMKKTKKF